MLRLAGSRRVVRWDPRGYGLSERDIEVSEDYLTDLTADIAAVIRALGVKRSDLVACAQAAPLALHYVASHPERVSKLVLAWGVASVEAFWARGRWLALEAVRRLSWDLYLETMAVVVIGGMTELAQRLVRKQSVAGRVEQFAHWMHESVTPEHWELALAASKDFDLSSRLSQVRAPTLVLHRKDLGIPSIGEVRQLASRIPDARVMMLDGVSLLPWIGNVDGVLQAIEKHLNS